MLIFSTLLKWHFGSLQNFLFDLEHHQRIYLIFFCRKKKTSVEIFNFLTKIIGFPLWKNAYFFHFCINEKNTQKQFLNVLPNLWVNHFVKMQIIQQC